MMSAQDHRFQMRCSDEFLAILDRIVKKIGAADRPEVVRIAVRELAHHYGMSTSNVRGGVKPNKKGRMQ